MPFVVVENDSRPRHRFDAFSTFRAKAFENDRIVAEIELYAHGINTRTYGIFLSSFSHLDAFLTVFDRSHKYVRCVFILIIFQERFQIDSFR